MLHNPSLAEHSRSQKSAMTIEFFVFVQTLFYRGFLGSKLDPSKMPTKQGTSHFVMYVNIRKLTYILSRSTVLYPLRTVVRK